MAEFKSYSKVEAELSNGKIVECQTMIKAYGSYREWIEPAPIEWMSDWTESEQDVDETDIEVVYPDEFEINGVENDSDITIKRVIKLLEEPEWEVQDGWQEY